MRTPSEPSFIHLRFGQSPPARPGLPPLPYEIAVPPRFACRSSSACVLCLSVRTIGKHSSCTSRSALCYALCASYTGLSTDTCAYLPAAPARSACTCFACKKAERCCTLRELEAHEYRCVFPVLDVCRHFLFGTLHGQISVLSFTKRKPSSRFRNYALVSPKMKALVVVSKWHPRTHRRLKCPKTAIS